MRATLRRRYGHGAARIPFTGSAPRWSARGSIGHALRPVVTALLGGTLMLLALPWFVPSPERDEYAPLELALVLEPPPREQAPAPEPEPDTNLSAQNTFAPPVPTRPRRATERPVLPRMASVESLPSVPDVPRMRARRSDRAPQAERLPVRADVGFAAAPAPTLAPVSAPPARAARAEAQIDLPAPSPVRDELEAPGANDHESAAPEGVPLERLAACASRREEDALKQRVIASGDARGTCESDAGSYHFVESRNLNAFLLRIRTNPDREVANRCGELRFALECLAQRSKEPSES
jgi:hypothetical protein